MGQIKRENRVHSIFDPQIRKKHHREKDGNIGHIYKLGGKKRNFNILFKYFQRNIYIFF